MANPEVESQQVDVDPEVLTQLVPPLPSLRRRISVGLALILMATAAGVGMGNGYVVPDPFPSGFEVQEVVVSPFGNGTDVYVQFAVANHRRRDVQFDRVYQDNELSPKVAALAELPETVRDGYGVPSLHGYITRKQGKTLIFDSPVEKDRLNVDELTHDLEELPVVVPGGNSIIVALIIPASSCGESPGAVDSFAAEVRFASYQQLSSARTERFDISDDVNVLAVTETGDMLSSTSIADAICEVAG